MGGSGEDSILCVRKWETGHDRDKKKVEIRNLIQNNIIEDLIEEEEINNNLESEHQVSEIKVEVGGVYQIILVVTGSQVMIIRQGLLKAIKQSKSENIFPIFPVSGV